MFSKRDGYRLCALSLLGLVLMGCSVNPERVFNAMDVDVAATDVSGNPTELFITDLGSESFACIGGNNGKIIRVDLSGNILWAFDQHGFALEGTHNADLNAAGDQMIISDSCNNRVLVIDYPNGDTIWDSSVDCPELRLNRPNDANFLGTGINPGEGNILVTVFYDHWVAELDPAQCNGIIGDGEIVWSWGVKGSPRGQDDADDPIRLRYPHNADSLPNGNVVIADGGTAFIGEGRIIEIDYASGQIAWIYREADDCTVRGISNVECPGFNWARDADVECADPACDTGLVVVTGAQRSLGVLRDLSETPPPGEFIPRGREVPYHVWLGAGFSYDTDLIPQWNDDDNGGLGFFLVSNHGPAYLGNWVRVVPVDAVSYDAEGVWELRGIRPIP